MSTMKNFAEKFAPLLRQKGTIDGHEVEHVFFVTGGFGGARGESDESNGSEPEEAGGGGVLAVPLGIYSAESGQVRFQVNPIVVMWSAVPLACICSMTVRSVLKSRRRSQKAKAKAKVT